MFTDQICNKLELLNPYVSLTSDCYRPFFLIWKILQDYVTEFVLGIGVSLTLIVDSSALFHR